MLVVIGIILLLVWLFDYAVHLTAGSLIDLLLLFAAISFGLDYIGGRSAWDRRRNWDHRPPKVHRRTLRLASRWLRQRFRGSHRVAAPPKGGSEQAPAARGQA
jgi:hypothetical protein